MLGHLNEYLWLFWHTALKHNRWTMSSTFSDLWHEASLVTSQSFALGKPCYLNDPICMLNWWYTVNALKISTPLWVTIRHNMSYELTDRKLINCYICVWIRNNIIIIIIIVLRIWFLALNNTFTNVYTSIIFWNWHKVDGLSLVFNTIHQRVEPHVGGRLLPLSLGPYSHG